jgi:K(+)-stimulated pyrophosphate-energized sodium pump
MGIFQSNAGGAWDNAKKSFEKGVLIDGEMSYKGSEPHKASVTGDTVGDPFKDTSGPSMNILIKLMSIVSLVIAPYIAQPSNADVAAMHKMHHSLDMASGKAYTPEMMAAMHKNGEECSPEMLKAMHKDGKECAPEMMAAAKKSGMSCCEKPGVADRFKK